MTDTPQRGCRSVTLIVSVHYAQLPTPRLKRENSFPLSTLSSSPTLPLFFLNPHRKHLETVWLTQAQMAELFQKDRTVIGRHIRNVYKEGELEEEVTCAKFAHMGNS